MLDFPGAVMVHTLRENVNKSLRILSGCYAEMYIPTKPFGEHAPGQGYLKLRHQKDKTANFWFRFSGSRSSRAQKTQDTLNTAKIGHKTKIGKRENFLRITSGC